MYGSIQSESYLTAALGQAAGTDLSVSGAGSGRIQTKECQLTADADGLQSIDRLHPLAFFKTIFKSIKPAQNPRLHFHDAVIHLFLSMVIKYTILLM
jgi:hypothetical protein